MSDKISQQSHDEALATAKSIQKPGQSKEQTKLIAAGIEKGIAAYKKQHKAKARDQDKQRKKTRTQNQKNTDNGILDTLSNENEMNSSSTKLSWLLLKFPWVLLALSWIGFISYVVLNT